LKIKKREIFFIIFLNAIKKLKKINKIIKFEHKGRLLWEAGDGWDELREKKKREKKAA